MKSRYKDGDVVKILSVSKDSSWWKERKLIQGEKVRIVWEPHYYGGYYSMRFVFMNENAPLVKKLGDRNFYMCGLKLRKMPS